MGISFSYDKITLDDGTYTFEDMYDACSDGSVTKLGDNIYQITKDIFVGVSESRPTILQDTQVTINALGDLFQIYKGSELRLGEKRADGTTKNGCTLLMPNIQLVYGFGYGYHSNSSSRRPDLAGNLYAYNSMINGFGFWAFFGGEHQVVEMIDCIVDGFGRIQGENSILKNITIEKSHGRYGILSPKGTLGVYENVSCGGTDGTSPNAQIYFNPTFAPQMRIVGGTYSGYEKLIYTEPNNNTEIATLEFVGSKILGNMERYTGDSDTHVFWKYIYNPVVKDMSGNKLTGLSITIKDKNNNVVENLTTDNDGKIYTELTRYQHLGASTNPVEEMNPYYITGTYGSGESAISFNIPLVVETDMVGIPLYIGSGGGAGGECDLSGVFTRLDELQEYLCGCSETAATNTMARLDEVSSNTAQVLIALSENVDENQVVIERGNKKIFL